MLSPVDPTQPHDEELTATVRIDAVERAKHFQGVWLELADGSRKIIDYRARAAWRAFEDAEVVVTGHHYEPRGQAIMATHFKVSRMRFARPPSRSVPYRSVGPAQFYKGALVEHVWPAGTRRAGDTELRFEADDGTTYDLLEAPTRRGPVTLFARELERDPAYAASTGHAVLWVIEVHDP